MITRESLKLIKDAVEQYIQSKRWQIDEIAKGLAEADRGKFATDEEVEAVFAKWSCED